MFRTTANRKYLIVILFALSLLLYARTLNYEFVWDDERIHLTENSQLMNGDVLSFWEKPYSGMYIPMSYTTWTLFNEFSNSKEPSTKIFHLINILTHSINCILIFQLLLILFKNQIHAFFGSLLFLLHPLQVESVAWISEFRGLYSVFFSILSLICIVLFVEKNKKIKALSFLSSIQFICATILFILAILSKPSAVILPFVATILIWCFYKDNFLMIFKSLLLWFLLLIPILLITHNVQPTDHTYKDITLWQSILIAGDSLFFYLYKLIIPYPLVACYGFTPKLILASKTIYITAFVCVCIAIYLFIKRNTQPLLFSAFAIIFFSLLPVLGFVFFDFQKYSNVADRYFYFAMLGVTLLIPSIAKIITRYGNLKYLAGSIFIIFVFLNIKQTNTWKNEFMVWDNTLKHYQNNEKTYYNRGVENGKMGKFQEAIADYTQCLSINGNYIWALANRANAYEYINDENAALADYQACFNTDSTNGSIYYNRACLHYRIGNIDAAIADVKKAESLKFTVNQKFKETLNKAMIQQHN
ncbi:MAG: tetratricopeptide repeat protein [Bacteroidota bacterium]